MEQGKRLARALPIEVVGVALLFGIVSMEILVTYWRLPASELYHVSGSGPGGGLGRVLVFLNFPAALVAIPVLAVIAERVGGRIPVVVAVVGVVLSAVVVWPGVVGEANLDAKWSNALPALGVGIAIALGVYGYTRTPRLERRPWLGVGDWLRVALAGIVLVLAVPWLAAELGLSFAGVPILGTLYQTSELRSQPGVGALHPAVHHGHHHGLDGVLLVLSALVLSRALPAVRRTWLRLTVGAYLALMLAYGLAEVANDFWLEQVVKRGWTNWEIPDVTRPTVSVAWGAILLAAAGLFVVAASATRSRGPSVR